jgi:ribosomal protein L17
MELNEYKLQLAGRQLDSLTSYIEHAQVVMKDLADNLVFMEFIKTAKQSIKEIQGTLDAPRRQHDDTQRESI